MPIVDDALGRFKNGNETFVETGTFQGDGVRKALEAGYKSIYSIEIAAALAEHNRAQFRAYENVTIIHGDSSKDLALLLTAIREPVTFWLDSHYSANPITGYNPEHICPVLQELEQIRLHAARNLTASDHVILIDDVRLFQTSAQQLDGCFNIPLVSVLNKLRQINQDYRISYIDGYQVADILVAQP